MCINLYNFKALASGITTLIGGGTGPNTGSNATTCTAGKHHIETMMQATDDIPLNFGFTGKGSCSGVEPMIEQVEAGCLGLKVHEDYCASAATIEACLEVCEKYDVQVCHYCNFIGIIADVKYHRPLFTRTL